MNSLGRVKKILGIGSPMIDLVGSVNKEALTKYLESYIDMELFRANTILEQRKMQESFLK